MNCCCSLSATCLIKVCYYFCVSSPEQVVASTDKNQRRSFKHFYNIYNKGPSPLFTGKINYIIPAVSTSGAVLVPVNTYEIYSKESKTNYIIKVVSGILTGSNDASPTQMSMQEHAGYVARRTTPEFQFYTTAISSPVISDLPNSLQANATDMTVSYVYPANIQDTSETINLWVIVGSLIGALVVFVVLGVILWKTPEFQFYTTAISSPVISDLPNSLQANATDKTVSYVYPANIQDTSETINLWVIVGSLIGALVVFVVLGVILWKCGFFKREEKYKLEKWKRQSNFYENRTTQRLSRIKSSTPKDDRHALSTE